MDELSDELKEAAERFVELVKRIPEFSSLRSEALGLVMDHFCSHCGRDYPPYCHCWNDE